MIMVSLWVLQQPGWWVKLANQSAVWHGSTLSVTWGNMFGNKYGQMHTDGLFLQIDLTFICSPAQSTPARSKSWLLLFYGKRIWWIFAVCSLLLIINHFTETMEEFFALGSFFRGAFVFFMTPGCWLSCSVTFFWNFLTVFSLLQPLIQSRPAGTVSVAGLLVNPPAACSKRPHWRSASALIWTRDLILPKP